MSDLVPIWVDAHITIDSLTKMLAPEGYFLRVDGAGRMVVTHIPTFLRVVEPTGSLRKPKRVKA